MKFGLESHDYEFHHVLCLQSFVMMGRSIIGVEWTRQTWDSSRNDEHPFSRFLI